MEKPIVTRINSWIRYSFYALFITVPLIMNKDTFELFEFPKMWMVFGIGLIILFLWASKIVVTKKFTIRRTPLDIPILIFFASQLIATLFSIDSHVSFWGYYSRFNGGLLSTISYIFLYYAFATHVIEHSKDQAVPRSIRTLAIVLITGIIVALWGLPSHFGSDLTCLMFRGTLDVSCWTAAFQPTLRIFSTLGQPNWLAAYLAVLIPISIGFAARHFKKNSKVNASLASQFVNRFSTLSLVYLLVSLLFYIDLIYTNSQSGFLGFWAGNTIFFLLATAFLWHRHDKNISLTVRNAAFLLLIVSNIFFAILTFVQGVPLNELRFLAVQKTQELTTNATPESATTGAPAAPALEVGGSASGNIRLIVWSGALKIFQQYPLFGTGPETFAFAYYKVRPVEHNLTSEWDYLYNKAHNEYLNYLTTSGIFGLGSYLLFIIFFFYTVWKIMKKRKEGTKYYLLSCALVGGFASILVSNFFGFSVVMINLFLFFIPLWFYDISDQSVFKHPNEEGFDTARINAGSATIITIFAIIVLILESILFRYWIADHRYALGNNLDKIGEYVQAYPELEKAVNLRPGEAIFRDELAVNLSTLALALSEQQQSTQAAQFALEAKKLSDEIAQAHPNNVVFAKSRTRVLYALSRINPEFNDDTIAAIERAHALAPTDAKIMYNAALLYDQVGDRKNAIKALKQTIQLKPNYVDARYALAHFQSEAVKTASNAQDAQRARQAAQEQLDYILKRIDAKHQASLDLQKVINQ